MGGFEVTNVYEPEATGAQRCKKRVEIQWLTPLPPPERQLAARDHTLARVISSQSARWLSQPTEDPIWGLVRIVMAQQISTQVACRVAERMKSTHPHLAKPSAAAALDLPSLPAMGLPERRAQCCVNIVRRPAEIRANVRQGHTWGDAVP